MKIITNAIWMTLLMMVLPVSAQGTSLYSPGTLGSRLETLYTTLIPNCIAGAFQPKKICAGFGCASNNPVSMIPRPLKNQAVIPLGTKVYWGNQHSIARAFATVYNDNHQFGQPSPGDAWLLYNQKFEDGAELMLPADTSNGILVHDCSAIVAGLASAEAGVELPAAQVKSAFTSSYDNKEKQSLAVVYGTFESPFFQKWNSAKSEEQVQAMMWLYNWYYRAKYVGNEKLIRTINQAVATYSVVETERIVKGALTINAAVRAGIAGAQLSSDGKAIAMNTVSLKDFQIAIPLDASAKPNVIYANLPSPTDVAERLKLISPIVEESSVTSAIPGTEVTHKIHIKGIDASQCKMDKVLWTVGGAGMASTPSLVKITPVIPEGNVPSCEFTLAYKVPTTYAQINADDDFTLTYTIEGSKPLAINAKPDIVLKFAPVNVRFAVNRSPEIFVIEGAQEPTFDMYALNWKRNLVFREDSAGVANNNGVDWSKNIVAQDARIVCPNGLDQPVDPNLASSNGQKTAQLTLVLTGTPGDLSQWKTGIAATMPCTARGKVKFATKHVGTYVVREYAMSVRYPVAPPTPPTPGANVAVASQPE